MNSIYDNLSRIDANNYRVKNGNVNIGQVEGQFRYHDGQPELRWFAFDVRNRRIGNIDGYRLIAGAVQAIEWAK